MTKFNSDNGVININSILAKRKVGFLDEKNQVEILEDMHMMIKEMYLNSKENMNEKNVVSVSEDNTSEKIDQIKANCTMQISELNFEIEILKNKEREAILEMKKISGINKVNIEFLTISFLTIIFSLIGLLIFSSTGYCIVNPILYIVLFFIGIGWGTTAISSIIINRR